MSKLSLFALSALAGSLLIVASQSKAQGMSGGCGLPPIAPVGMYYVCLCDAGGNNCNLVLVSKR